MSPGRHAAADASFVRSAGGAATRGIILIVVAVLIGVVLIATAVDDGTETITAAPNDTSATTTPPTDTSTPAETTAPGTETTAAPTETTVAPTETTVPSTETTAAPTDTAGTVFEARPNSVVSVQVVNTTRVGGAAGRMTDTLKAQGYVTLSAATDTGGIQAVTKVHHIGGYLLEAQKLAELLGLDPATSVFSMPANPGATIDNYLDPQVLVLLGSDLAQ